MRSEIFGVILRASIIYLYALILVRLSGKRSIVSLTPMDFLVALLIGDQFDDVFWGQVPLASGLTSIGVIILLHTLVSFLSSRNHWFNRVIVGCSPTPVIRDGNLIPAGLRKERTNEGEVWSELRFKGMTDLKEIKEGNWEPNGRLSVIKQEPARTVTKEDLSRLLETIQ